MTTQKTEWKEARCPVCGLPYVYAVRANSTYLPKTCNKFDCIHRFFHDPKYKRYEGVADDA